ncbi:hypothetical protein BWI17_20990 [Betaproteobacteria bacterium GR16-43]|nr:hypothetical protein BWI17_20990 [Betaproteobacteria bacterium GR16-43]
MDQRLLLLENATYGGTGGVSRVAEPHGFRPAFFDMETFAIYPSRFCNGAPAPFHILDGLPDEVVIERHVSGRVVCAKPTIISGFVRGGAFYTREAAARAVAGRPADAN